MFSYDQEATIFNIKMDITAAAAELGTIRGKLITAVEFAQDDTNNETQYFCATVIVDDDAAGNESKYEAMIPMLQEKFDWVDFASNMGGGILHASWNVNSYVQRLSNRTGYTLTLTSYPTRRLPFKHIESAVDVYTDIGYEKQQYKIKYIDKSLHDDEYIHFDVDFGIGTDVTYTDEE